jgi:Leucine-rich repeat (LRR) protein
MDHKRTRHDQQQVQAQQQQQQQQQEEEQQQVVLRVLLSANPRCIYGFQLLRPFHLTCHAGRLAALQCMNHLDLRRCKQWGVPYNRQLSVLLAADCASALTIYDDQVSGLLGAMLQLQQEQQQQQEEEDVASARQGHGLQLQVAPPACRGDMLDGAQPCTSTRTTNAATTTTSSSSRSICGPTHTAAVTVPAGVQAAASGRRWLEVVTVFGDITLTTGQHLVQLLDVLPCTQQLVRLELRDIPDHEWRTRLVANIYGAQPSSEVHLGTAFTNATFVAIGSSTGGKLVNEAGLTQEEVSAGVRPSWRTRCCSMMVCRQECNLSSSSWVCISHISWLLHAMRALCGLYLEGVVVTDLPTWACDLRPLQLLTMKGGVGVSMPDVLAEVALLTALQELDLSCEVPHELTQLPVTLSNLVHVTSLCLEGVGITSGALEAVCGISGLRRLEISNSRHCTSLPDSISNLESLDSLIMVACRVYSLPGSITASRKLQHVTWAKSTRRRPLELDMLWSLSSLQSLSLVDGDLTTLPPAIGQLTALTDLLVKVLSLVDIPANHLRGLECLTLMIVEAEEFPEAVTTLTHLTSLELYCESLLRLPSGLGALVGLQHLVIKAERLEALPASITALTALTSITLQCPALQALPPAVKAFVEERVGRVQQ